MRQNRPDQPGPVSSSRIIIKNIPPSCTQDDIERHFGSDATTDVKLVVNKEGRSRRIAFIGYREASDASAAVDRWNKTFIGSCKIQVELAAAIQKEYFSGAANKTEGNGDGVSSVQSSRLFIRNLPFTCDENDIRNLFITFGSIKEVREWVLFR